MQELTTLVTTTVMQRANEFKGKVYNKIQDRYFRLEDSLCRLILKFQELTP